MKIHRFFVGDSLDLKAKVWVNDQHLLHQWTNVLRFKPEREIILFDSDQTERLYKIDVIEKNAVHLSLVTELKAKKSEKEIYLCWSLLKKDKNEWIIQKATELGVSHFVPIVSERTEKTGFDNDRAQKIAIEASEQCGRVDIPRIREPINLETAIHELKDSCKLLVCEQGESSDEEITYPVAIFIGPEGGWSDDEKNLFKKHNLGYTTVGDYTLRAETASIAAVTKIVSN